jgi:glycosyltransferase involved in cell wall biosynthesis
VKLSGRGALLQRTPAVSRPSPQPVLVSVVVPHYRDPASLRESLASLAEQRYRPLEVIVIDDGSPDEVYAQVAALCDGVAQLARIPHRGPSAARNHGAALAKGAILVFCEADARYPPDYVAGIVAPIAACQDGSVVAASNVGRRILHETGAWGHRYARLLYAAVDDAIRRGRRRTGAWAFDARWFRDNGGYREELKVGEDLDLVERVAASGRKVAYGADIPFFHREPESLRQLFRRAWRSGVQRKPGRLGVGLVAVGIAAGVGGYRFGIGAGALLIAAAGLAVPLIDPTWRLVLSFGARDRQWREAAVASVGRSVWILGYVTGAVVGALRLPVRGRT